MSILVVDYGLCNLDSVLRAIQECGGDAYVSDDPAQASVAERIVLPGVGSFHEGARALKARGWYDALRTEVRENNIPLLGICLGMQLLATRGFEGGESDGLGLVPGDIVKMVPEEKELRIPHVGWNEVQQRSASPLFEGIPDEKDFYFVHSYHFVPESDTDVLATTPYGDAVVSVVGRGSVWGTQFHPEKSLRIGARLLKNFLERC
jgi:imidazole glycerol-phosphate synthase subunit HisH